MILQRIVLAVKAYCDQARRINGHRPSLDVCLDYVARSLGRELSAEEERAAEVAFAEEVA